jgi:hypothetical protein
MNWNCEILVQFYLIVEDMLNIYIYIIDLF